MIRVLHLITRLDPGGTELQLLGMLRSAHMRLWKATMCVLSPEPKLGGEIEAIGVPVVTLDGLTRIDPRRAIAFRRLAGENDIVHSSLPGANAFARLTNLGSRRPAVVVSERGVDYERPLLRRLADIALRGVTDAYIGNSPDVTDFIAAAHRVSRDDPRMFEIGNGIDGDVFYPPSSLIQDRLPARVIAAGRLVPGKRFDLAIAIIQALQRDMDVELVIVGDGPERARLESAAEGLPVRFLGHVDDRRSFAQVLRDSDVLLMTSSKEGMPNVVLEALACGLPVVASNAPGIRAASGPGVTLVDGAAEDWAQAIVGAVSSGRQALDLADARVTTFEDVARRHLHVFQWAMQTVQADHRSRRHSEHAQPTEART